MRDLGPTQHNGRRALVGCAEHVLGQRVVHQGRLQDLLLAEWLAPEGVGIHRSVAVVLGRHPGQRPGADVEVVHVALYLHGEELRSEEQPGLAVPARHAVLDGVGGEGTGQVLVHADGHAEVVFAEPEGVGRLGERAGRRGAAVVDVGEGEPGQPEEIHHGVGVVHLVAAPERELDVLPGDPGVLQRQSHRLGRHLDGGHAGEPAEGVAAHPDDGDVVHGLLLPQLSATGRKA